MAILEAIVREMGSLNYRIKKGNTVLRGEILPYQEGKYSRIKKGNPTVSRREVQRGKMPLHREISRSDYLIRTYRSIYRTSNKVKDEVITQFLFFRRKG